MASIKLYKTAIKELCQLRILQLSDHRIEKTKKIPARRQGLQNMVSNQLFRSQCFRLKDCAGLILIVSDHHLFGNSRYESNLFTVF